MIDCEIKDFKLDDYLTYLADNLVKDSEVNTSLDMSPLDYSSLFKRLVGLSISEPTLDTLLSLMVISSIMLATKICTENDKEYVLATTLLYTYLSDSKDTYTLKEINKQLIQKYLFIMYNCSLSKLSIVVHSLKVLSPTLAKRVEQEEINKKVKEEN